MARQDPNPPPWNKYMSDGCSGVPDWLPIVGSMLDCCIEHDRAYYYGGTWEDKQRADRAFRKCIADKGCYLCKAVAWWRHKFLKYFVKSAFNWKGKGDDGRRLEDSHYE